MKNIIVFVLVSVLLSTTTFAQTNFSDSLNNFKVNLSPELETVPEIDEENIVFDQNYIYKSRLDSIGKELTLPYNEYIQTYIDIYAKRKDMFGKMLGLSSYYFPIFEKALKEYDIPSEIKYLPIIESAMNPHAVSRVGATGLWQFMFGTGKEFGLKMDNYVDERKDPIQASYAAAAYFRKSYDDLGDWLLSIASYNCGRGNVNRAIEKAGSRDFWEIRKFLPAETRNYVPAFIAAVYVMNYYDKHDISPKDSPFIAETDTIMVNNFVSLPMLAEALEIEEVKLAELNPSYKKKIVPGSIEDPKRIILPKLHDADFDKVYDALFLTELDIDKRIIQAKTDDVRELRKGKFGGSNSKNALVVVKVKSGQTLSSIAKNNRVKVQDIKVWNNLKSLNIVAGQNLKIYKSSLSNRSNNQAYLSYKVKPGDTLSNIAQKFDGVTIQKIKTANKLTSSNLKPGMVLKISKS